MRIHWLPLVTMLAVAGCDPETPVQETAASTEIEGRIAAHAADANTHTNLLVAAGRITGQITGDQIADGTISFEHIATGGVGSDEIADGSIAAVDIGQGAVGTTQLADDAVTGVKIADTSVGTNHLANVSVTTAKIALDAITDAQIADNAVTSAQIANGTIALADMGNDSVDTNQIVDLAVVNAKIDDATITGAKIAANTVTAANIAAGAITAAGNEIADYAITQAKLGRTNMSGQYDMNAALTVSSWVNKSGNVTFTVTGACRSEAAASTVILKNGMDTAVGQCADALTNPYETFKLTVTAANDDLIEFQVDPAADGDITEYQIYSVSF